MEPFTNYYLEKSLANFNMSVKRFTNVLIYYLKKENMLKEYLKIF